jgi:hypothetical protein
MGTHHYFKALRNPMIAEKLFKFKMKKLIDLADQKGFTNTQNVEIMQGGACTGYTLLWCTQQFGGISFGFARDGTYTGNQGTLDDSHGGVVMYGVELQLEYQNESSRIGIAGAQKKVAATLGLDVEVDKSVDYNFLGDALDAVNSGPVGVYLVDSNMRIGKKKLVSHALGALRHDDGNLYVFDSNCGEYKVKYPKGFAVYLEEGYENWNNGDNVTFQNVYTTPVKKSANAKW